MLDIKQFFHIFATSNLMNSIKPHSYTITYAGKHEKK